MVPTGLNLDAHRSPSHRRFIRVRLRDINGITPQLTPSSYVGISTDAPNHTPSPQPSSASPSSSTPHPADSSPRPSSPVASQLGDPNQIGATAIIVVILATVLLAAVVGSQFYRKKRGGANTTTLRCCFPRGKISPSQAPTTGKDPKDSVKASSPATTAPTSSASTTLASTAPNTPLPKLPMDIRRQPTLTRHDSAASLLQRKAAALWPGSRFTEVEDRISNTITLRSLQAANPSSWTTTSSCLTEAQYLNFCDGDECYAGSGAGSASTGSPWQHERVRSQTDSEIAVRLGRAFHATYASASGSLGCATQQDSNLGLAEGEEPKRSLLGAYTLEVDDHGMGRMDAEDTPRTLHIPDLTYGTAREADGSFSSTVKEALEGYYLLQNSPAESSPSTLKHDFSARTVAQRASTPLSTTPSKATSHISFSTDSWESSANEDSRDVVVYELKRAQTRSLQLQVERAHLVSLGSKTDDANYSDGSFSVSVSPPARETSGLETAVGGGAGLGIGEDASSGTVSSIFSLGDFPLPPTRIPTM